MLKLLIENTLDRRDFVSNWAEMRLSEIAEINPHEVLKKGAVAKKVPMDKLQPYCRDIPEFIIEPYSGGAKFRNGDTIMARITPCLENGKIAQVNILDENEVGFGSTEYIVFRARKGNDADFIYYLVSSSLVKEPAIKSMVGSSGRQRVQIDVIKNLLLKVPELKTQRAIASILKGLDDKIGENNKVNHNLEQQASALVGHYMQSIDTSVSIANIMSFDSGFPFQSSTYLPSGKYRIITIKNVQDGNIETSNTVFINNLPTRMKNNCILHVGDVLLSLTGNVGRVGIVCEENLLLNQRVAKIVPNDIGLLPLLYFIFRQPDIKLQMELIAKGTAQSNLSPVETLRLTIPFERKTAEALSRTLAPMYQTIISTTQESHSLSSLRDALLPKLMSGEIDVSEVEL